MENTNDIESKQNTVEVIQTISNVEVITATSNTANNNLNTEADKSAQVRWWQRNIFVLEIPIFLIYFGIYISESVFNNEITYRTCTALYKYTPDQCKPFLGIANQTSMSEEIQDQIYHTVSKITLTRSLIEGIIPVFICLFIGPWTDKYGRRPILIATFSGHFLSYVLLSILAGIATNSDFSPWIYLVYLIPLILSGGTCVLITVVYCYISDKVDKPERPRRFILNLALQNAGIGVGVSISYDVYSGTSVVGTFCISMAIIGVALLYIIFLTSESLKPELRQNDQKLQKLFSLDSILELVHTCYTRRPNFGRFVIWMSVTSLTLVTFISEGETDVSYLWLSTKFYFTVSDYSFYISMQKLVQIVGSIVIMIALKKFFNITLTLLTIVSLISCAANSLVCALAEKSWEVYLGLVLGCMGRILTSMLRAIISFVVMPTEFGKVFTFATSMDTFFPTAANPMYTAIYEASATSYAGVYNFVSFGFYLISIVLVGLIYYVQKSHGHSIY